MLSDVATLLLSVNINLRWLYRALCYKQNAKQIALEPNGYISTEITIEEDCAKRK